MKLRGKSFACKPKFTERRLSQWLYLHNSGNYHIQHVRHDQETTQGQAYARPSLCGTEDGYIRTFNGSAALVKCLLTDGGIVDRRRSQG